MAVLTLAGYIQMRHDEPALCETFDAWAEAEGLYTPACVAMRFGEGFVDLEVLDEPAIRAARQLVTRERRGVRVSTPPPTGIHPFLGFGVR